jgi:hypothetical protein
MMWVLVSGYRDTGIAVFLAWLGTQHRHGQVGGALFDVDISSGFHP